MEKKMINIAYTLYLNEIRKVSQHLHDDTDCGGDSAVAGLLLAVINELVAIGGEKATFELLASAADVIKTTNLKPRTH